MKLLRHGPSGVEKTGILHCDDTIRNLTGQVPDIGGAFLSDAGLAMLRGVMQVRCPPCRPAPDLAPVFLAHASAFASV